MATLLQSSIHDANWDRHIQVTSPLTVTLTLGNRLTIIMERKCSDNHYQELTTKLLLNEFEMQELGKAVDEYRRQKFIEQRKQRMKEVVSCP